MKHFFDKQVEEFAEQFPQNKEDFLFYMRGNRAKNEINWIAQSDDLNIADALFNIYLNNEIFMNEIEVLITAITNHKMQNN